MLKETFLKLSASYTRDESLALTSWKEIETNYSNKKRHYHTLQHLGNLFIQITEVKPIIDHWDTTVVTLFFHDVIYNPLKSDNEERSAVQAEASMTQLSVPAQIIENCKAQILATKKHLDNSDSDTNYFTDADLSVLGQDWTAYTAYYKGVRKEYSVYPALLYNPGRRKVLQHFLTMDGIFKTDHFYTKFEQQAKQNLQQEFELLR